MRMRRGSSWTVRGDGQWELYTLPAPCPNILRTMRLLWDPSNGIVCNPHQEKAASCAPLPPLAVLVPVEREMAYASCIGPCDPQTLHDISLTRRVGVQPCTL